MITRTQLTLVYSTAASCRCVDSCRALPTCEDALPSKSKNGSFRLIFLRVAAEFTGREKYKTPSRAHGCLRRAGERAYQGLLSQAENNETIFKTEAMA